MNHSQANPTEIIPGSRPLRNGTSELYAHARARFHCPAEAARIVGISDRSGQCSKLERSRKVADRIAYLAHEPEAKTKAAREEIERFYWLALRTDRARFFERLEEDRTDKSGHSYTVTVHRPRDFEDIETECRQLVEGLTVTESGKPNLKLVTQSFASEALRKLLGLDAPAKFAPTNPEGTQSYSSGAHEFLAHLLDREASRIAADGAAQPLVR